MRDCESCVYARPYGGENDNRCFAWSCEFIDRKEAIDVWKKTRWTPCEKELPKEEREYLVYIKSKFGGLYMILNWCDGWNCFKESRENKIDDVIAWMELPKAYEVERYDMRIMPVEWENVKLGKPDNSSSDFIRREDLIDAIDGTDWYHMHEVKIVYGANGDDDDPLYKIDEIIEAIKNLPRRRG